uniref:(northern house mosquito) hypothetical protein n=1 Tax=Culex pipiens TaxID=7175 RepID=A0A8D8KC26_CULPI
MKCQTVKAQNVPPQGRDAAARWLQKVPKVGGLHVQKLSLFARVQPHPLHARELPLRAALERPAAEPQAQTRTHGHRGRLPEVPDGAEFAVEVWWFVSGIWEGRGGWFTADGGEGRRGGVSVAGESGCSEESGARAVGHHVGADVPGVAPADDAAHEDADAAKYELRAGFGAGECGRVEEACAG